MSVTINFSKNTSAPWQSNANMLKSTREKIQRQEERDGKIAFFETQKQNLKNQKADTIEEIAKKLEKFTVTCKSASNAIGYRIQYSTDYRFRKSVKTIYSPTGK